ncbi:MAG: putative tRNA-dihydrouridine synthase [Alphaproteobacteria bacterium MarineAlpha10_Bin3]|jgi:tRNA-dihydrouridine synthase B|nr:MAG: putative tRNA-dihydrouridine synthase [Alphaproteobacteria bacterium MarineAlpha10_Bin3]PPR73054.1 MAG: putative tRNA-dihydrouridine synthase [Alphaproteobacteria bacterium MarineAlpha4_Bin1]
MIGELVFDAPVFLAPMSGVTDLPFRRLARQLGAGLETSEMIACREAIQRSAVSRKKAARANHNAAMAVQLAGHDPDIMAEAAKICADEGADIIDLNFGCPAKKVVGKQSGSALMRDERHAARILEAVVSAVDVPVTLKMRTGWDDANRNAPALAYIAQECGIRLVTVHGRTRAQRYRGQADWRFIRRVKQAVRIPVVANGDITSLEDVRRCLEQSGADGVMIGRGACGRPWFIRQAVRFLATGVADPAPSLAEQSHIVLDHFDAMLEHHGLHRGLRNFRKHISWYSNGLKNSARFRSHVYALDRADRVRTAIGDFYAAAMDDMADAA